MTRLCEIDGCTKKRKARGLCPMHYERRRAGIEVPTLEQRFWGKVDTSGECWIWTASKSTAGYGKFGVGGNTWAFAHRVSMQIAGIDPAGYHVDHICRNRACVRPEHLRLATSKQNQENQAATGRSNKSGMRGVWWDPERERWRAQVTHEGRVRSTKGFFTAGEAAEWARAKRNELFTYNDADRAHPTGRVRDSRE